MGSTTATTKRFLSGGGVSPQTSLGHDCWRHETGATAKEDDDGWLDLYVMFSRDTRLEDFLLRRAAVVAGCRRARFRKILSRTVDAIHLESQRPTPCADAAPRSTEAGYKPSMRVRPCATRKGGGPRRAHPHAYGVERARLTQRGDGRALKRLPISLRQNGAHYKHAISFAPHDNNLHYVNTVLIPTLAVR